MDFSSILLLYLDVDKILKACPLSLKYPVVFPLEEPVFMFQNLKQFKKMLVTLTFDYVINPFILFFAIVTGAVIGYGMARGKIAKSQSKLRKLEEELMHSHHETLESQHAFAELESRLKNQAIPVIPMKINGNNKETPKEKEKARN